MKCLRSEITPSCRLSPAFFEDEMVWKMMPPSDKKSTGQRTRGLSAFLICITSCISAKSRFSRSTILLGLQISLLITWIRCFQSVWMMRRLSQLNQQKAMQRKLEHRHGGGLPERIGRPDQLSLRIHWFLTINRLNRWINFYSYDLIRSICLICCNSNWPLPLENSFKR